MHRRRDGNPGRATAAQPDELVRDPVARDDARSGEYFEKDPVL